MFFWKRNKKKKEFESFPELIPASPSEQITAKLQKLGEEDAVVVDDDLIEDYLKANFDSDLPEDEQSIENLQDAKEEIKPEGSQDYVPEIIDEAEIKSSDLETVEEEKTDVAEAVKKIEQELKVEKEESEVEKEENIEDVEEDEKDEESDDAETEEEDVKEKETVVEFIEDKTEQPSKKKREHKPFFLLKIIGITLLVIFMGILIFGIWNRWFRYDDNAQIISNWQISGTDKVVVIDGKQIILDANAVLKYTVDSGSKVINYTIGDMSGQSHYRFSWDRNQLALIEGGGMDSLSTMFDDLCWFWDYMTCSMSKVDLSPAYTKNNKNEVNTDNTGIEDIISNGQNGSILLDRISTKKPEEAS